MLVGPHYIAVNIGLLLSIPLKTIQMDLFGPVESYMNHVITWWRDQRVVSLVSLFQWLWAWKQVYRKCSSKAPCYSFSIGILLTLF